MTPTPEARTGGGSLLARLRALRPTFPPVMAEIADTVLLRRDAVIHMSITELAEAAGASEGSVVAFCRRLGLKGFQSLKLALARELVEPIAQIHEDLSPDDTPRIVAEKVFRSGVQALNDTLAVLDELALDRAAELIGGAAWTEVYGIGTAAPIAIDAYHRLTRLGLNCKAVTDSHAQVVSAALLGPQAAVLTISHSGSTVETLAATRLAREAGARTVCITGSGRLPIHAHAEVVLQTAARETRLRTEAMASRIAELALIDALTVAIALRSYERSVEAMRLASEALATKRR